MQVSFEVLEVAANNLRHQGLRTYLTILGVIIGIAAIVTLVSLGNGLNNAVVEQFEAMKAIPLTSEADVQFLASFADLEPDVDLARKRLQAAKERLANLKRQYSKMLQAINVAE